MMEVDCSLATPPDSFRGLDGDVPLPPPRRRPGEKRPETADDSAAMAARREMLSCFGPSQGPVRNASRLVQATTLFEDETSRLSASSCGSDAESEHELECLGA